MRYALFIAEGLSMIFLFLAIAFFLPFVQNSDNQNVTEITGMHCSHGCEHILSIDNKNINKNITVGKLAKYHKGLSF